MELTCQKSLQLHLPHRVLWLVTKSSGYNLPQILWNLLALLGKTITRQLEHIIFGNTIYSKILAFRICKLQNSRFLHSLSTVGDQEAVAQLLIASEPIQPADEKSRQWVTKWSNEQLPAWISDCGVLLHFVAIKSHGKDFYPCSWICMQFCHVCLLPHVSLFFFKSLCHVI